MSLFHRRVGVRRLHRRQYCSSWVLYLFVIIPLSHGSADPVNQSTEEVCSSGTLSGVSVPQRRSTAREVRRSADQSGSLPTFWQWKRNLSVPCLGPLTLVGLGLDSLVFLI